MKIKYILFCLVLIPSMVWSQNNDSKEQHALLQQIGSKQPLLNNHPLAQWFPDAGLGLFVHFGMAAVHGGIDLSWGMIGNKAWEDGEIAPTEYWKLADKWKPVNFNPDNWVKAAKEAGFKYVVFTAKHHDGYTLWPSRYGDFGVKQKMNGRDLVKEVVDACHKYGLKVGLYFSPPDWHYDRLYRSFGKKGDKYYNYNHELVASIPQKPEGHDEKRIKMVRNQLKELLTEYGRIDLMWFDGGQAEVSNDWIRKLQPGIVINRRNKQRGDYGDSEGGLPKKRFIGWFETCDPCWPSRCWSFSYCDRMDSGDDVIENLVRLRAWGGNYLANVGPAADGSIPEEALEAWNVIGKWMNHSGESIYGTRGGGWSETANQPVTVKEEEHVIYLHAFPDFQSTITVKELNQEPVRAVLLRTGDEINFQYKNRVLRLSIPNELRTRQVDTVKLYFK